MKKKDERPTVKEEERKSCSPEISMRSPEMDLSAQSGKEFSPTPVSAPQPTIRLKQEIDSQSPMSFPPMPTVSALAMTPPHSKCKYSIIGCRSGTANIQQYRTIS